MTFIFSRRGEKDTIFTMLTVPTSPFSQLPCWTFGQESKSQLTDPINPRASRSPQTGLASPRDKSQLSFLQNHQNSQPLVSRHDVIHNEVPFPIWGFYYDICDCHILRARTWTAPNVCTCTCTKPNSSKPNQIEW